MSELGRLLAEARTINEISLADAESATRVRQKYLEALEQGNYAALPPSAIARGFLRNYARYLGLNSAEILHLYDQESGDRSPVPSLASLRNTRPIDYRPLEVSLIDDDRPPSRSGWRWLVVMLLIAVIAAGFWWLYQNNETVRSSLASPRTGFLAALGPQPTSTHTPTAVPARALMTITPPVPDVGLVPSPTSDLLTLPIPTTQPTPTPTRTPAPTAVPPLPAGISLTLKITQRSWTKVTVDGNVVMQELLEAGQERSWSAKQSVTILTGYAAGVNVSINGQNIGPMGSAGQVTERTWSLNKEGNIAEGTPAPAAAATPAPTRAP